MQEKEHSDEIHQQQRVGGHVGVRVCTTWRWVGRTARGRFGRPRAVVVVAAGIGGGGWELAEKEDVVAAVGLKKAGPRIAAAAW